jgi:predicted kinase
MGRGQRAGDSTIIAAPREAAVGAPATLRPQGNVWLTSLTVTLGGEQLQVDGERHAPVGELRFPEGSLVAFCGVPGVGKSTLADRVLPADTEMICVDELANELAQRDSRLAALEPQELWMRAFGELWQRLDASLERGQTTVVHLTGLKYWQQRGLARHAQRAGRPCHMILLDGDTDTCVDGQRARGFRQVPNERMDVYAEELAMLKLDIVDRFDDDSYDAVKQVGMPVFASVTVLDRPAADQLQRVSFESVA